PAPFGGGGAMQQLQQQPMQPMQQPPYGMMQQHMAMPPPLHMPPPPFGMPPPGHMGMPPPPMMMGEQEIEEDEGPFGRMGVACPAPLDVAEILKEQQAQQAAGGVRRGAAGFGSQLPPSMGGAPRASTPELVARALDIRPLPQRPEERQKRMEMPDNAADLADFLKARKDALLSDEGFMGDPTIRPLPKAAQERIQKMLRAQELEEEREARRLAEETAGGGGDADGGPREPPKRRSRGGVKHRERQQMREQQARERAQIETSKRLGVYETPIPGAPVAREVRPMPLMALKPAPPPGFTGGNIDDDGGGDDPMMGGGGGDAYEGEQGPSSGYGASGRDGDGGYSPDDAHNSSSMDISRDDEGSGREGEGRNNGEQWGDRVDVRPPPLMMPPPPPPPPGAFRGARGGGPPPPPFRGGFRGGFNGGFEERGGGGPPPGGWHEDRDRGWPEERGYQEERGWNGGAAEWQDDDGGYYGGGGGRPPRPLFDDYPPPHRGGRGGPPHSPMRGGRGRGG
ncbi:hypothetical protein PRIPAC_75967, partial [Pristionchus pacificus]